MGDSAMASSQFSIKPMKPKLDTITRIDDKTKESSVVEDLDNASPDKTNN